MSTQVPAAVVETVLSREQLSELVEVLRQRGFTVIGPTVRDGAIVLDEIGSAAELPYGWGTYLDAGTYRLRPRPDGAAFANAAGPQSWKTYLHPARVRQWTADRVNGRVSVEAESETPVRFAFLGVRPCDLRAIQIQDRVLNAGPQADPVYRNRRSGALLVAVECTEPGGTCFCASMGTGPAAGPGYDLVLTELVDDHGHRFWVRSGSAEGAEILGDLPREPVAAGLRERARSAVQGAVELMGRAMPETDLRRLMSETLEAPRWDDVASRCLTCGNCTMVCPTCFCTTTEDVTDLTGDHAERWRVWDSCFDLDFSHLPGGPVRASPRSRYRQWLTHKLGTWHDQFGTSGCVGCGRCIVWCPVAIDITKEAAALYDWTRHVPDGAE